MRIPRTPQFLSIAAAFAGLWTTLLPAAPAVAAREPVASEDTKEPTPKKESPETKEPAAGKRAAAARRSVADREPAKEAGAGRRLITLEQAYDIALATDQSIRTAFYEIRKANLQPWSALARMGPSLSGGAGYNAATTARTFSTPITTLSGTTASTVTTNQIIASRTGLYDRTASLSLDQPLLDFTVFPAYRLGKLTVKAAYLQQQFTVRQTLFGVAQAYYNVLKQQSVVGVNQQTVDLAQKQLDLAQTRFDLGAVARIDVMRARATLEDARNTLIQSKGLLEVDRDTLSNILNMGGKTDFVLVEPPNARDDHTPIDRALDQAYAGREDYKVGAIAIEQDKAKRDEIRAQYAPKVVAQASTGWTGVRGNGSTNSQVNAGSVTVQIPFLTGGQREIDLRTASHIIEETRITFETTRKKIEAEVKAAWIKVDTARESIKALRAEVDAATQNYTDLQAQYEAGTVTSLDVQSALRDLNNSRTLLISQIYDYQVALRDLARSEALFENQRVEQARVR